LSFPGGRQVIGNGLIFIKADAACVCPYESPVKDASRKLFEVFFFHGAKESRPNFGGQGYVVQGNAALFARFLQSVSEWRQAAVLLGSTGNVLQPCLQPNDK
jgi:hypothetical protein